MKSVVVGTDENGKATDAPVVIRDEAATDSDDGDIKLSSRKPVLAVRLFEIAIREKGEKNPTDGRIAVHKSHLKEVLLREKGKGSNASKKSKEAMVRNLTVDIRKKAADEIGEYFYPKAANDNIKFQRTGEANSEHRTPSKGGSVRFTYSLWIHPEQKYSEHVRDHIRQRCSLLCGGRDPNLPGHIVHIERSEIDLRRFCAEIEAPAQKRFTIASVGLTSEED